MSRRYELTGKTATHRRTKDKSRDNLFPQNLFIQHTVQHTECGSYYPRLVAFNVSPSGRSGAHGTPANITTSNASCRTGNLEKECAGDLERHRDVTAGIWKESTLTGVGSTFS